MLDLEGIKKQFYLNIDGRERCVDIDLSEIFSIDESNLKDTFLKHPAVVAWFTTVLASYQRASNVEKDALKLMEASFYKQKREELEAAGKKVTETLLNSEVYTDPRYQKQLSIIRDLEEDTSILQGIKYGLDHKLQMLIQLGGLYRSEITATGIINFKAEE
jgi:hypothetical protein